MDEQAVAARRPDLRIDLLALHAPHPSLYSTASQNDKGLRRHGIDDERLRGIAAIVRFHSI